MKLSIRKSAAIVAALSMATTGALMLNQNKADAATIATVNSGTTARLYTDQEHLITNRALAPNTPWLVGKIITNQNGDTYYQVATNEYLKATDSKLNRPNAVNVVTPSKSIIVTVMNSGHSLPVYNDTTKSLSNRALADGTRWQVGKIITNQNGDTYYQVSTHEYLLASGDAVLNHDTGDKQYIADFMIKDGTSSNTNDDNNQTTTTPSTDNNNSENTNTDVTTPDTNTGNTSKNLSVSAAKTAVINSINAERQSKGLPTLTEDPALDSIASKRAQEISTNFSHNRPDGSTYYKELHATTSYAGQGENISSDDYNQLQQQTPEYLAKIIMDNYRGEGISSTWNHYSAIINPKATKVGVGVYVAPNGQVYTAEDFAA